MERFSIVLEGKPRQGVSRKKALANLASLLKKPPERVEKLLGKRVVLKRDLSTKSAKKTLAALQRAGMEASVQLQLNRAFFLAHLVAGNEQKQTPSEKSLPKNDLSLTFPLGAFAPWAMARPKCVECHSQKGLHFLLVSHRWKFSHGLITISSLIAAFLIQRYILVLAGGSVDGTLLTISAVLLVLLLMVFLPPLFSVQRLLSLQPGGDENDPVAILKETYSLNPLQKRYRLMSEAATATISVNRYGKPKAEMRDERGRLRYQLFEQINSEAVLEMVAQDLRQKVAGLGWIDRLLTWLSPFAKSVQANSRVATRQNAVAVYRIEDAAGKTAARVYKGSQSVVDIKNDERYRQEGAGLFLLALIGLRAG